MWKKLTLVLALTGALALAGCAEGGETNDIEDPGVNDGGNVENDGLDDNALNDENDA
jgi:hypothetical protein